MVNLLCYFKKGMKGFFYYSKRSLALTNEICGWFDNVNFHYKRERNISLLILQVRNLTSFEETEID